MEQEIIRLREENKKLQESEAQLEEWWSMEKAERRDNAELAAEFEEDGMRMEKENEKLKKQNKKLKKQIKILSNPKDL